MKLQHRDDESWVVKPAYASASKTRRSADARAQAAGTLPKVFLLPGVSVAMVHDATPKLRRGAEPPALEFQVDCNPSERAMVVVRHPSGALTFHPPAGEERKRRGRGTGLRSFHFRVDVPQGSPARRGLASKVIKVVVVKLKEALVDEAVKLGLRVASRAAEKLWWKKRDLQEGWCSIDADGGLRLRHLDRVDPQKGRALLFIHGTFSDTAGSFGKLIEPGSLADLFRTYRGNVFGFEHFTVSRSPEENAKSLLEALPDNETVFDVVSYSRGGLLLRMLAEQPQRFGSLSRRFKLGQGVLVSVPNGGTPLATGQRWEETFGLVANLLEWLPDNPWTTAAEFVANGIVWMAGHASGDLPGLGAMDAESETIASLQSGDGPVAGSYSAIGANYHPENALWKRLVDAGIDGFFAGANDLVVPTDGAWQVDPGAASVVPVERIACFGFDGNVQPFAASVHHLNVLGQPETSLFIQRAIAGRAQELQPIDLSRPRRSHKLWRGAPAAHPLVLPAAPRPPAVPAIRRPAVVQEVATKVERVTTTSVVGRPQQAPGREGDRTLQLMILGDPAVTDAAYLLAMYGSARVLESFPTRNREGATGDEAIAGTRFQKIIALHERIGMNLDGRIDKRTKKVPQLPDDDGLCEFGELLFDALFVGRVRRLYDVARSEQRSEPLNVIFTCNVPWIAAKPWEFAFDPARRKFLATEEVHFIRNVLTSVPAQRVYQECERLRMLVVEAQPIGTAELALEDEKALIEHRFQPLTGAGLIEIEVLTEATAELLHERLFGSWLECRPYDIVHFIGHGEFDREAEEGRLLFNSSESGAQKVDVQTLREILCNRGVQVVFLNACDTARDATRRLNRGVAQALVQGGLPAVVANQYKVLDPSAISFAQHFYWALAHGASLGEAARESRIAVNYSMDGDLIDWAVPVIYARDPDYRLCKRLLRVEPMKRATKRPTKRAAKHTAKGAAASAPSGGRAKDVGVADISRFFPGLPAIIARLNEVQNEFEFRQVELAAPMGVWDRDEKSGESYLHADRFAKRLKNKPKSLGVDFLSCITHWWMRDDDYTNLYGWWSADPSLPIMIFSTAGLSLPAEGPVAGRSVANGMVAGLANQMIESTTKKAATHEKPPINCPFYYNENRDIDSVSGRLRFDGKCRKLLLATLPAATVEAFDALLGAYDAEIGDS